MAQNKPSVLVELNDVKKSIDRLAIIELCKSGAARTEIRDVMGGIDNNLLSKINKALKRSSRQLEEK
ncbi:MAG TPA: hypothetical protein PKD68_04290 [Candidatus Saccharibacteria bacterium]|nr:hypothetical protein [Candidatus Saccharibacteria bacterium]